MYFLFNLISLFFHFKEKKIKQIQHPEFDLGTVRGAKFTPKK